MIMTMEIYSSSTAIPLSTIQLERKVCLVVDFYKNLFSVAKFGKYQFHSFYTLLSWIISHFMLPTEKKILTKKQKQFAIFECIRNDVIVDKRIKDS